MFSIVIPVFNEENNIITLIKEIKSSLKFYNEYELIFVNDFSTDNTLRVLEKEKKNFNFKIINNKFNQGQSFSILNGIKNSNYNTIITLDGDGQNNPKDIPILLEFYNKTKDASLVGGIRHKRRDNIIKIISSRLANFIRSNFLKDNCKDTGCSLKVFDKDPPDDVAPHPVTIEHSLTIVFVFREGSKYTGPKFVPQPDNVSRDVSNLINAISLVNN